MPIGQDRLPASGSCRAASSRDVDHQAPGLAGSPRRPQSKRRGGGGPNPSAAPAGVRAARRDRSRRQDAQSPPPLFVTRSPRLDVREVRAEAAEIDLGLLSAGPRPGCRRPGCTGPMIARKRGWFVQRGWLHFGAVESGRAVDVDHPSRSGRRRQPSSRCGAPRRSTRTADRAPCVIDVQQPSPNFRQVLSCRSAIPAPGHGNMSAGVPSVGRNLETFHARRACVSHTSSRFVGRIDRKPRDRLEVVLDVVGADIDPVLPSTGFCHSVNAKPSASFRSPVPSQLTMKISDGPGTCGWRRRCDRRVSVSLRFHVTAAFAEDDRSPLPSSRIEAHEDELVALGRGIGAVALHPDDAGVSAGEISDLGAGAVNGANAIGASHREERATGNGGEPAHSGIVPSDTRSWARRCHS